MHQINTYVLLNNYILCIIIVFIILGRDSFVSVRIRLLLGRLGFDARLFIISKIIVRCSHGIILVSFSRWVLGCFALRSGLLVRAYPIICLIFNYNVLLI